jgi:hypothetical protein
LPRLDVIPPTFDDEFLSWLRDATERAWAHHGTRTLADFQVGRIGGLDWQRGTRWLGGLTGNEIATVEKREGLRFPPDFRLFLERLHATDRPRVGAGFAEDDRMVPMQAPGFYNWLTDVEAIHAAVEGIFEGLLFDVEEGHLWFPEWGEVPASPEDRAATLRALVRAAPRLIPVFGHRFLVAEPCVAGNPVLSIHQSDIIIYGSDLRTYLLADFDDLVGLADPPVGSAEPEPDYSQIPFWGGLIDRC